MELNTLELKNDIHSLVNNTDDETILFKVKEYFSELKSNEDWWNLLSLKEKASVEDGTKQLDNGVRFSHDEVRKEIDKILKSK